MSDKGNGNKEFTTKEGIGVLFNALLYVVWFAAPVILLGVLMAGVVNGEFIYALICLPLLVIWVVVTRVTSKKFDKHVEKEAEKYKEQYVTSYEVNCGWLGTLRFDYDRRIRQSVLQGSLPPIFSEGEAPKLASAAERVDGALVEQTVNRLFAERGLIYQTAMQEFERVVKEMPDFSILFERVYPTGLKLLDVSISDSSVNCELVFLGLEGDLFATVSFESGFVGYKYYLHGDEDV